MWDKLVARREHRHAGFGHDTHAAAADFSQKAQLDWPQQCARLEDGFAAPHGTAERENILARSDTGIQKLHAVIGDRLCSLQHYDGISAGRNGSAGHDAYSLAATDGSPRHGAGNDLLNHGQLRGAAGKIGGNHRVAVDD